MSGTLALKLYDVEHSSVEVTLSDDKSKKILHLSPVTLSYWSDYFQTRYDPNASWRTDDLVVEDVSSAENVLRSFYAPHAVLDEWESTAAWADVLKALRFCDMIRVREWLVVGFLNLAIRVVNAAHVVNDVVNDVDIENALSHLHDLGTLEGTYVADVARFSDLCGVLFDHYTHGHRLVVRDGSWGDTLVDALPRCMRPHYLWHEIRGAIKDRGTVKEARAFAALIRFAKDLVDMRDDEAKPYLERVVTVADLDFPGGVVKEVMQVLDRIKGDEASASLVLRTRDALAVRLKGGIGEKVLVPCGSKANKRKRSGD